MNGRGLPGQIAALRRRVDRLQIEAERAVETCSKLGLRVPRDLENVRGRLARVEKFLRRLGYTR